MSFGQNTYKPYQEGYLDKKPYHQKTPYALKSHSQVVENLNKMEYFINVDGTLHPLNEEIIIENIGTEDIINPRLTINDRWNWFTCKLMAEEITRDSETDFQVSPFSVLELSLGRNKIEYFDQTNGKHKVKITHKWYKREDNHYPNAPSKPFFPADGGEVNTLTPVLKWIEAIDPDKNNKIVDYHILLSDRPDCKWALSPNFDVNIGYNLTEWKVPESWFNSNQTYYWKVKSKDQYGNWSNFSKVWSFRTR